MTKIPYSKAPLSFIGQKRNFIKAFRHIINANIIDDGEGWTVVDVFGGSCLLAHNAKHLLPKATVIYNDFDGYVDRLNYIEDTERLRQQIYSAIVSIHAPVWGATSDKEYRFC